MSSARISKDVHRQWEAPKDPRLYGAKCDICPLRGSTPVWGDGPKEATYAFIGEAPGKDEVSLGMPFVGASGTMLVKWIQTVFGLARTEVWVDNAVMCVEGSTNIRLADGTTQRIAKMVKDRNPGPVISVQEDGTIVARRVTGWFQNSRNGRRLFKVTSEHAKALGAKGMAGPILTADHKCLTSEGWLPAEQLSGKMLATGHGRMVGAALEAFEGVMLGDGTITRRALSTVHVVDNTDYIEALSQLWLEFIPTLGWRQPTVSNGINAKLARTLRLGAGPWFGIQRERWYPEGKKIVPRDLQLTPMTLATWFMDDGHTSFREGRHKPRGGLATCGFTKDDVEWLAAKLNSMGLSCYPNFTRWARINFSTIGTERINALIAPYVVPSMQYKLIPYYRGKYRSELWKSVAATTVFDRASIKEVPAYGIQSVYCLEVEETHNFASTNGVLHNCFPPGGDMKAFLQRSRKEHKAQNKEFNHPVDCCRERLLRSLGTPRCKGCGKFVAAPDDKVCRCVSPKMVTFKDRPLVPYRMALGNFALLAILGVEGIGERRGYDWDMLARRAELAGVPLKEPKKK